MRVTAVTDVAGSRPVRLDLEEFIAFRDMLGCVNAETGPVLRASTFLGSGAPAGGGYAGHAEIYDLDGLLRNMYSQPSMEPGVNDTLFGGGKGLRLADTMLSTIGEAVERAVAALVSCSPHLPSDRIFGSFDDLSERGFNAIDPETIGIFSDDQYDRPHFLYRRFERGTPVQWVEGVRLRSKEPILVPSQLVDMVHIYEPAEEIIGYPVSGGLSCHTSQVAAVFHGLTEVIERDAVNVSWYTDQRPKRLRIDESVRQVLGSAFCDHLLADHSLVELLLHESDVCSAPTFSIVGIQDWLQRRQYCAGGGCDIVAPVALRKAAVEFGQTRSTIGLSVVAPHSAVGRSVQTMFDWEADRPLVEMDLFFQAIGYYGLDDNLSHLDYYLSGPEIDLADVLEKTGGLKKPTVNEGLEKLLHELGEKGIDPIVLDYSHPDWQNLSVAKVYVPELTTPFLQSRPMLGHQRLADVRPQLRTDNGHLQPLPYP